jgi:hypothetical protein
VLEETLLQAMQLDATDDALTKREEAIAPQIFRHRNNWPGL